MSDFVNTAEYRQKNIWVEPDESLMGIESDSPTFQKVLIA